MSLPKKQSLESFVFILSLLAGGIVLIFSILNSNDYFRIGIHAVLSFVLMYFLCNGLLVLWEKISPPPPPKETDAAAAVDILLGDLGAEDFGLSHISQEDKSKNLSRQSSAPAALKAYRGSTPGQINPDMKNGMPDAETQAEMVRRMGWGEE
jgi:hypothetical protein